MYIYLILECIAWVVALIAGLCLVFKILKIKAVRLPLILLIVAGLLGIYADKTYPPNFAMPAFMHSHAPGGMPASIPFSKVFQFFGNQGDFERVVDIGADPNAVPSEAQTPDTDGVVRISLETQEVVSEIAPGIFFNYWTFSKQVPGPMLRVRQGDIIEVTLSNHKSSLHNHNIDFHAVTGPGGGAVLSNVAPGESKAFRWKALNPGLYVYHCAMPNVSTHNSHGQYGMILVEPSDPTAVLSKVDKEFYVMQGEFYTEGDLGKKGLVVFDSEALLDGIPNYVTFNGKVETLPRMQAKVGDRVRMYVGNGGVNLISAFHVIGEIFDKVYANGGIGADTAIERNTQTALVLPGGSSIVEFTLEVPGKYLLVDHALARMNKGAWAVLEVSGEDNPDIFGSVNLTK